MQRLAAEGIDVVRVTYPDLIGTDRGRDVLVDHLPSAWSTAWPSAGRSTTPARRATWSRSPAVWTPACPTSPCDRTWPPWPPCRGSPASRPASPTSPTRPPAGPHAESPARPAAHRRRPVCRARPASGGRPRAGVLPAATRTRARRPAGSGTRAPPATSTAGLRGDPRQASAAHAASAAGHGHRRDRGNHEFAGGQFEINLHALRRAVRRGPRLPVQVRDQGAGPAGGQAGDVHGQAVQRRGRLRLPPALLDLRRRRRPQRLRRPGRAARAVRRPPATPIAGVLAHAPALAALANPTVNSYKRFGPDTLAPWLIDWGLDNRSAMVRIPPERGRGARLELRLGDASANPYLLIAGHGGRRAARGPGRAGAARAAGGLRLRHRQGGQCCP